MRSLTPGGSEKFPLFRLIVPHASAHSLSGARSGVSYTSCQRRASPLPASLRLVSGSAVVLESRLDEAFLSLPINALWPLIALVRMVKCPTF